MLIGALQRPWRPIKRMKEPETIFIMARRNYKIAAYIGLTRSATSRFAAVLDTGAGSSFIRSSVIPTNLFHVHESVIPIVHQANEYRFRGSDCHFSFVFGTFLATEE